MATTQRTVGTHVYPRALGYSVDPAAGIVYGPRGHAIGRPDRAGYLFFGVHVPGPGGRKRIIRNHRAIWEAVHGEIPDGLEINHINGVKDDNRIENLELVTPKENTAHAIQTGLRPRNHGETHPKAKLTEAQVIEIIELRREGAMTTRAIAAQFGVAPSTVSMIATGRNWKRTIEAAA